ncbi:MAG TPA: sulfurtransferase TusA family protein [Ktedonobacterales bacterium]|nr:sulfurtransferase TusA family protein [Ktedonobacterales bacterium]
MSLDGEAADGVSLRPDAVLDLAHTPATQGATCAVLTPAIKEKLRQMEAGQVLEVVVDDPSAREDLASWCRLSGHELLAVREESPRLLHAYLRKKQG